MMDEILTFEDTLQALQRHTAFHVEISLIRPDPDNPRGRVKACDVKDLAASIGTSGVLQPLTVRAAEDHFVVRYGHRRLAACVAAGLDFVPCLLCAEDPVNGEDAADVVLDRRLSQLIENEQREGIDPIALAGALKRLRDEYGLNPPQIAAAMKERGLKLSRTSIANTIGLLDLPKPVQARIKSGELSGLHGRYLRQAERLGILDETLSWIDDEIVMNKATPSSTLLLETMLQVLRNLGVELSGLSYFAQSIERALNAETTNRPRFDWERVCKGCEHLRTLTVEGVSHSFCMHEEGFAEKQTAAIKGEGVSDAERDDVTAQGDNAAAEVAAKQAAERFQVSIDAAAREAICTELRHRLRALIKASSDSLVGDETSEYGVFRTWLLQGAQIMEHQYVDGPLRCTVGVQWSRTDSRGGVLCIEPLVDEWWNEIVDMMTDSALVAFALRFNIDPLVRAFDAQLDVLDHFASRLSWPAIESMSYLQRKKGLSLAIASQQFAKHWRSGASSADEDWNVPVPLDRAWRAMRDEHLSVAQAMQVAAAKMQPEEDAA